MTSWQISNIPAFTLLAFSLYGGQALSGEQLYKKVVPSVMTLTVRDKEGATLSGTAFLAFRPNIAVTAWHVVRNAASVSAKFSSGEEFECSGLIDRDEKRDVALIRVKVADRPILEVSGVDPEVGSKAYVVGAPRGFDFTISDGLISQIDVSGGQKLFQFSCPASPGNSGGPLLNAVGEVIGVVSKQRTDAQNLSFAVPCTYARGLDATLPTQPWDVVKAGVDSGSTSVAAAPFDKAAYRKAFEDCIWSMYDAAAALTNAADVVVGKKFGYRSGATVSQFESISELDLSIKAISGMSPPEPAQAKIQSELLDELGGIRHASELEKAAIEDAVRGNGWVPGANAEWTECVSAYQMAIRPTGHEELNALLADPAFQATMSTEMQSLLASLRDGTGFRLGIIVWPRSRNGLASVVVGGFGYELGFRSGDVIVTVDGSPYVSLTDLRRKIKENLGGRIRVGVTRDGKDRDIVLRIPREIPAKFLTKQ